MKNVTSLLVGLFLSLSMYAQQKLDYDTDSRWFWGLNVGSTWTKADVAKKNDWGYGLTIGKAFNYNYGRKFSFDIRGRYLTGEWFGQNYDTTDITGIYPYNLSGTDYSSTLGYSVLNHKTRVHELSLELVIHANNLRARTGWDPYVFGGIGYSWYKATGNLLGMDGNLIQYDQLLAANDISKESITDVFGVLPDYETNLINDPAHTFARNWMPSLGLGLGYQFGKRFSMGIEHKTTFTRADNFDGYLLSSGKYANDWYHYTSFYMTFQLRADPIDEPERKPELVDQTTPTVKYPPIVDYRNPMSNITVNSPNYNLVVSISNVLEQHQVQLTQNGKPIYFNWNRNTGTASANVMLQVGANLFTTSGTNEVGTDQESITIIYERLPEPPTPPVVVKVPPVVTITNPSINPKEVTTATYAFESTVLNVTQQNQITVELNGQNIPFVFNPTTHQVTGNLTLIQGANTLQVAATNTDGSDSKQTVLIYQPAPVVLLPEVSFVQPQSPGQVVAVANYNMLATVLHVTAANQITVSLNGQQMPSSAWTFNASSHTVSMNTVLLTGNNVFVVTGTNSAGTANATTTVIFREPVVECIKPSITLLQPTALLTGGTINLSTITLTAQVSEVVSVSAITCRLNGVLQAAGTYSSGTYSRTLVLVSGQNVIELSATNNCGTTTTSKTIVYRAPQVEKPIITLKSPTTCPAMLARGPQVITGTVSGVTNASQVTMLFNNAPVVFTSTIANNTLTFSCTITVLANTLNFPLVITATNQGGVTVKECLISIKDYAGGGNDQTSPVDGDKPKPSPVKPRTPIIPTDTIRKPIITPPTTPAQP